MPNVIVGCKLPHGLIIRLPNAETPVTLKGANSGTIVGLDGKVVRGTCGFTPVDEAFITQWLKLNAPMVMVKKGLVFVQKDQKNAAAEASDKAAVKTGFEAVDPEHPTIAAVKPVTPEV